MVVGVTGASGHVGNVLCRRLLEKGFQVKAMYHSDRSALMDLERNSSITIIQGSTLNLQDLENFIQDCDIIINSAAIISILGDPTGIVFRTNTEGPRNLVQACVKVSKNTGKNKKIKVIHISSTHAVYELPHETPYDENRPYKQKGAFAYDYSKATGEQIILDAIQKGFIEGCILRPSSVIGPYDFKPSEIGKALKDFYNQKIPLLPSGGYNFVDVRDVAHTIISAMDKGQNGEIYLISGEYFSLKKFVEIIHKVTGKKMPFIVMPFLFLRLILPFVKLYSLIRHAAPVFTIEAITALKAGHPNMIHQKAREVLGHHCRPLEESIRDFYEWNQKRK